MRLFYTLFISALLSQSPVSFAGAPGEPLAGFQAEFKLKYAAFSGDVLLDLRKDKNSDNYIYEVSTKARGLASVILRRTAVESTHFTVDGNRLRPVLYHLDDGRNSVENKTDIRFDWDAGIAYSKYEGEDLEVPIESDTLDRLSADIIVIMQLRAGETPGAYSILDGEDIDIYEFKKLGEERITVPAGEFTTVKYRRQRPGSKRSTLIWYAPEQDYLPVRIEQQKNGKTNVSMSATLLTPG